MTYIPNIPIGVDSPANQVTQVQTNFAQLAAKFSQTVGGINYNHSGFNSTTQGDHESVIFQNQSVDPAVTQNLVSVYAINATSASGTQPQLFARLLKYNPNIANNPMQLTFNSVNTAGPIYQSFLVGGYTIFFGKVSVAPSTITLSPTPTIILTAIANANNHTAVGTKIPFDVQVLITQPNQITILSVNGVGVNDFTWMAICKV